MNKGEKHHSAVLTALKVRSIRRLFWVKGLNSNCIAKLYGMKNQTVYDAATYRTWRHIEDNFKAHEITRPEFVREDLVR